jgi:hypothetical protein
MNEYNITMVTAAEAANLYNSLKIIWKKRKRKKIIIFCWNSESNFETMRLYISVISLFFSFLLLNNLIFKFNYLFIILEI